MNEGLIRIGENAFSDCDIEQISIPASVRSIDDFAFSFCKQLKYVNFKNGIHSIGKMAFQYCTSLEKIFLPESVEKIGTNPFIKCSNLTDIKISERNKRYKTAYRMIIDIIEHSILCCPESLQVQYLTIPSDIFGIKDEAFYGIDSLKKVTIHEKVLV